MVTTQVGDKIEHTGDVVIGHILFKMIEGGCDFLLFLCFPGEKGIANVSHCLAFYAALQIVHTQIIDADFMPKDRILRFGIHHHSVEIEKDGCCFYCIHV